MAKIRQNAEQYKALKLVNDLFRDIENINKILNAGEEEQFVLTISGPEKMRVVLPQNVAVNTMNDLVRGKKKTIKEKIAKYAIDLTEEEEALLS